MSGSKLPPYLVPFLLTGIIAAVIVLAVVSGFNLMKQETNDRDVLYQVSTIDALMQSVYDGVIPESELREHGDMGIGTFEGLDGEMIAVDGNYYQVKSDGRVYPVNDSAMIPFATVTYFDNDKQVHVNGISNFTKFTEVADLQLPSKNLFYAIRIDGTFPYVKTRSIPMQEKPYPTLVNASKEQSVFEFNNVTGTIVGFYTPQYAKGINVPGYHLHLITADRKSGGHILELSIDESDVCLDVTPEFTMDLPTKGDFIGVDLSKDLSKELEKVEK